MTRNPDRPLSPHLTIWKWGPGMLVSILHRVTGGALAVAGMALFTWWLWAIAAGADEYERFVEFVISEVAGIPLVLIVLVLLTWAFWQHLLSGIRHMVMDSGAGFELRINRLFAVLTIAGSLFLTALTWAVLMGIWA